MALIEVSCFVSYAHDNMDAAVLNFIIEELENAARGRFRLDVDTRIDYGHDINEYMSRLNQVDAAIILLTPEYKRKIDGRDGFAFQEYECIMGRYLAQRPLIDAGKKPYEIDNYLKILPILVKGSRIHSSPNGFPLLKYPSLAKLSPKTAPSNSNQIIITDYDRKTHAPELQKLANEIILLHVIKSKAYGRRHSQMRKRLFREVREAPSNAIFPEPRPLDPIFVKTRAYFRVKDGFVYLLIGRKGSGKSTLINTIAGAESNRYKGIIPIVASEFNLESHFAAFNTERFKSDSKNVFDRIISFQMVWECFLMMCSMEILTILDLRGRLTPEQSAEISPLHDFITELRGKNRNHSEPASKNAYFTYARDALIAYQDHCIRTAGNDAATFEGQIADLFTREAFLTTHFGADTLESFNHIVATCSDQILVTLDGLDTAFDEFRKASLEGYKGQVLNDRISFEIDWLRSLLHFVLAAKERTGEARPFFTLLEFCITLPKDRFMDIKEADRDSIVYEGSSVEMNWSGIELAIMLRKRLEALSGYSTDPARRPEERLQEVLEKAFPGIPTELIFSFEGRQYRMPLFLYVLRHSFWRPRDILHLFSDVLAAAREFESYGNKLNHDDVRSVIKNQIFSMISDEFIGEYKRTVTNISHIVEAFSTKQFFPYNELEEILEATPFILASGNNALEKIEDRIVFLFDIGFLGVRPTKSLRQQLGLMSDDVFKFNEGSNIMQVVGSEQFKRSDFLIHPAFSELLGLDYEDKGLILNFNWDYLRRMEGILGLR